MVRISEDLVRKRAEHNECEIFTLEELSLHQLDIERIEHLDKWCKELKILYLQSNLIPRIENVSKLKKLNYLNLALNNIEKIENLEGCEFLSKLDLTVNFIGDLESIENLIDNYMLKELYLTGNPCTEYEGYRDYVIATLPQLLHLDGTQISRSERIKALQNYKDASKKIREQQEKYFIKREQQKKEHETKSKERLNKSPEDALDQNQETAKKQRKYFADDGTPFNCNEPKVEFELTDDDENILLNIWVFKYMDSSLVDVDVQPNYVRVTLKGKILQLVLQENVKCELSSAQRSQTTGQLLIKIPKQNPIVRLNTQKTANQKDEKTLTKEIQRDKKKTEYLEVDNSKQIDFKNIVNDNESKAKKTQQQLKQQNQNKKTEKENSPDFVDDPDVPPLI